MTAKPDQTYRFVREMKRYFFFLHKKWNMLQCTVNRFFNDFLQRQNLVLYCLSFLHCFSMLSLLKCNCIWWSWFIFIWKKHTMFEMAYLMFSLVTRHYGPRNSKLSLALFPSTIVHTWCVIVPKQNVASDQRFNANSQRSIYRNQISN